ncbi:MAG: DUF1292 domain-containing protein [Bacilli bacterium]|nr:DUF1292 domain-containing protein [Bacilli bacterium]
MDEEIKVVRMTEEDGTEYDLEVMKEFDYNNKKYIALYDGEECECENEECDCNCDDDKEKGSIYIFEIAKDQDNKDGLKEIEDQKLMDELIKKLESLLFEKDK